MNKTWKLASEEQAQFIYRIPVALSSNKKNRFWGNPAQLAGPRYYGYGPLPLIGALEYPQRPDIVTLCIQSIEDELLEDEAYNPLVDPYGCLLLDKSAINDTIELLLGLASELHKSEPIAAKVFQPIDTKDLESFHIYPHHQPYSRQFFYIQDITSVPDEVKDRITIVLFSTDMRTPKAKHLFFSFGQVKKEQLEKDKVGSFFDKALAQIHLNQEGIQELCALLQSQLTYLSA